MRIKPKSRNIRQGIDRIARMNLAEINREDISKAIQLIMGGYTCSAPIVPAGGRVYRARICDRPSKLTEISYPPPDIIKVRGRGNDIGESVFYCSPSKEVTLRELRCSVGDRIVLSAWKTNADAILNHIGFTEETKEALKSSRDLGQVYDFVTKTNNFGELNEMIHEYLGFQFSKVVKPEEEQAHYKLTSVIAEKMTNSDDVHGLIYPTNQLFGQADNILFKTSFVDANLEFVNAEYVEITEVGESIKGKTLDCATTVSANGDIQWNERPWQWVIDNPDIVVKFERKHGHWLATDQYGNVLEPV